MSLFYRMWASSDAPMYSMHRMWPLPQSEHFLSAGAVTDRLNYPGRPVSAAVTFFFCFVLATITCHANAENTSKQKSPCDTPALRYRIPVSAATLLFQQNFVTMSKSDELPKDAEYGQEARQSSTASEDGRGTNSHAARYNKVHKFFGFGKGYNFPLCKSAEHYA